MRVGIVGVGMVGRPIKDWFLNKRGYYRGKNLFLLDANPRLEMRDDLGPAELVFVCVPTPQKADGSCDTSIVRAAVAALPGRKLVVIKSTVVPGTTADLQRDFPQHAFIFSPEFLTESQAGADFLQPNRQILGTTGASRSGAIDVLGMLPGAPFVRPWYPIFGRGAEVTATEAEVAKYGSNVFGAVKVTFANIIADACHLVTLGSGQEVRYESVRSMLAADQRIGDAWLDVSHGKYAGFGGFCFPKDLRAFITFLKYTYQELALDGHSLVGANMRHAAKGIAVLEAVDAYNTELLEEQGLTREDVMCHASEIPVDRVHPVRTGRPPAEPA